MIAELIIFFRTKVIKLLICWLKYFYSTIQAPFQSLFGLIIRKEEVFSCLTYKNPNNIVSNNNVQK